MDVSIRLEVDPTRLEISPGGPEATINVNVLNTSAIVDEFVISAIGIGKWLDATEARVRLFPDKRRNFASASLPDAL